MSLLLVASSGAAELGSGCVVLLRGAGIECPSAWGNQRDMGVVRLGGCASHSMVRREA